ncbi:MAG: histidine ammonia-lyase [Acidimicrobiales bacterium]|nr:histidine ammonia-lyase [Acidimicrobiales bacterium]
MIELGTAADLDLAAYDAIVRDGEHVAISAAALDRVRHSRRQFLAHLDTGVICYGVTTGLGAMSTVDLTPEQRAALPRQTLLGRASGTGAPLPPSVGRGALLAKLVQFLDGHSAVSAELCIAIAERLNLGIRPVVPGHGFGMAGEIIPLSHAAQPLIGEGSVFAADGSVQPSRAWHSTSGIAPYEPQSKEGLSLISGTGVGPAWALHLADDTARLLATANLVAAASIEGLAAPLEPYGELAAGLNPDPAVAAIAAAIRTHLADSAVVRQTRQAPVSSRVIPQVHAVALDALDRLRLTALADVRANGDNPAFFAADEAPFGQLINSGNFHGAALAARVETMTSAVVQLGMLSEKRLYRMLDDRASGLPRQLAADPGLDAGLITVHKAALAHVAALRMLAAPASVMQGDSSFGQEDAMTMVFPALERLRDALGLTHVLLSHEAYVALVAIDVRGQSVGRDVEALRRRVRAVVAPYNGDRSYGTDLDAMIALL